MSLPIHFVDFLEVWNLNSSQWAKKNRARSRGHNSEVRMFFHSGFLAPTCCLASSLIKRPTSDLTSTSPQDRAPRRHQRRRVLPLLGRRPLYRRRKSGRRRRSSVETLTLFFLWSFELFRLFRWHDLRLNFYKTYVARILNRQVLSVLFSLLRVAECSFAINSSSLRVNLFLTDSIGFRGTIFSRTTQLLTEASIA